MRFPPISVWQTFPKSDPLHPVRSGNALVIVNLVFMVLTCAAVYLRLYTRILIKRRSGYDDWAIVVALFFALGLGANSIVANVRYGWNRHVWDLPFDMFQPASICAFVGKVLFSLSASFVRMSLIFFYYRLIQDTTIQWFRIVLHMSMVWTVAVGVAFTLMAVFTCNPIESYWVFPIMPGSTCLDEGNMTLAAGIINSIADLEVTLLPIPLVMRLQLPLRQRLGVVLLLSLGIIVTAAGVVRTYYIWKSLVDSWDETWYAYQLWISACVEIDLAVLCACAPALKPLFSRLATNMHTSITSLITRTSSRLNLPISASDSSPITSDARRPQAYTPPGPMRRKRTASVSLLSSQLSWLSQPVSYTWQSMSGTGTGTGTGTGSQMDRSRLGGEAGIELVRDFKVEVEEKDSGIRVDSRRVE